MPRLEKFTEALVDHYCPEKAMSAVIQPLEWFGVKEFIHSYKQKKEFKKALIYAESKLLPFIQKPEYRARLKGEHLEKWIKALHKIAAKTVLSDWGVPSGEYITEPVYRWEKTTEFLILFRTVFTNFSSDKKKRDTFIVQLFAEYGLESAAAQWLEIISMVESKKLKRPSEFAPKSDSPFSELLFTLAFARTQGLLSESQNAAVDKTCKIVLPSAISEEMKAYCADLVQGIIKCDGNLDTVACLAALAFRDLTKIHPFPNANGRVSTIILNLILVGFNYPSIVLRNNQDREDQLSEYNQVVANMDDDLNPLINYIKKKISHEKQRPDSGTVESTPAQDDKNYLLSDALFALVKEFRQKEKAQKKEVVARNLFNPPVSTVGKETNDLLKSKLNTLGGRFGFNMMYFPAYVEYTDEEMLSIKTGHLKL